MSGNFIKGMKSGKKTGTGRGIKGLIRRGKAYIRLRKQPAKHGALFISHAKYSMEVGRLLDAIMKEGSESRYAKTILKDRKKAILQLMDHNMITRDNLPAALKAVQNSTTGRVLLVANEIKRPEDLKRWVKYLDGNIGNLNSVIYKIKIEKGREHQKLMGKTQRIKI